MINEKISYFDFLKIVTRGESKYKKSYTQMPFLKGKNKKLYAFYLPQFHPILINDKHWGKGFTEWSNVSRALPLFINHVQPRIPTDLGYYDLRCIEKIHEQARLANNYGIDGFFIYYYWFDGKKYMETPIEKIYNNKSIALNYSVFWANENWTKAWDGSEQEIILKQNHNTEDDIKFIAEISKYFEDNRYIEYKNRPILSIYRPGLFPNPKKTVDTWRNWLSNNGFKNPYLIMSEAFTNQINYLNPNDFNFDAAMEFPPHLGSAYRPNLQKNLAKCNSLLNNSPNLVHDYKSATESWSFPSEGKFHHIKTIFPSWDNSPRRVNGGAKIYQNSNPLLYKNWLKNCLRITEDNNFVCINAWNEWAEGAFLEPDLHFGTAYLEATWEAQYELLNKI